MVRPELEQITVEYFPLFGGEDTATFAGIGEVIWAMNLCPSCAAGLTAAYEAGTRWQPPPTECEVGDANPCWGWRVVDVHY